MKIRRRSLLSAAVFSGFVAGRSSPDPERWQHRLIIDTEQRFQTIDGWGTCLVSWKRDMQQLYLTDEFTELYLETMGSNMLRINLWGGVHSTPVANPDDIRAEDFDFTVHRGRAQIFIDVGQRLLARNPDMKFIASVWSPPAWMKFNNSLVDTQPDRVLSTSTDYVGRGNRPIENRVRPEYFPHFAAWVVEMVRYHAERGIHLDAISPANEPSFSQTFESCVWLPEELAIIIPMIRQRLDAAGFASVKILTPETMTGLNHKEGNPGYIRRLQQSDVVGDVDIWATHGYTDGIHSDVSSGSSAQFRELLGPTDKPYWVTEGGTGGHDWPEPLMGVGAALHNSLVYGGASAVLPWQISSLTERNQHNLLVGTRLGKKAQVVRHFWTFVRPGDQRVHAEPSAMGPGRRIVSSGFINPQTQRLSLILINPTATPREIHFSISGGEYTKLYPVVTDSRRDYTSLAPVSVSDGQGRLTLSPLSITTLVSD